MKILKLVGAIVPAAALCLSIGCQSKGLDTKEWTFSGKDERRGIDHYYKKSSLVKTGDRTFTVTTKIIPAKGKTAVEEATAVKRTYSVVSKMEVGCSGGYVRVLEKDYQDEKGGSLRVEKDTETMDSVREIKFDMPIYKMFRDICG